MEVSFDCGEEHRRERQEASDFDFIVHVRELWRWTTVERREGRAGGRMGPK